jgi:hypothetical protein
MAQPSEAGRRRFVSATILDMEEDYKELVPDQPAAHSAYRFVLS